MHKHQAHTAGGKTNMHKCAVFTWRKCLKSPNDSYILTGIYFSQNAGLQINLSQSAGTQLCDLNHPLLSLPLEHPFLHCPFTYWCSISHRHHSETWGWISAELTICLSHSRKTGSRLVCVCVCVCACVCVNIKKFVIEGLFKCHTNSGWWNCSESWSN